MERLKSQYKKHRECGYMVLGILAVSLIAFVYVLLGERSYLQVPDQVDGEILNYIYQAKYLFQGNCIPEFMNGMSKVSMTPPAPLGVLIYKVLPPFAAFVCMQWLVVIVGFVGMYGLCRYFKFVPEVSFAAGVLFAYMPFYPTYGLTSLGQPLVILCFLRLCREKKVWSSLLGIVFFAAMSSLTLGGFVFVAAFMGVALYYAVRKMWSECKRAVLGWGSLVLTYVVFNFSLMKSLLGGGFVSHREEMVLKSAESFGEAFERLFFEGGSYSLVYSPCIFAVACLLFVLLATVVKNKKRATQIGGLLLTIALCTALAALWNVPFVLEIRESVGGALKTFQADRLYFTFPFLWMLLAALLLQCMVEIGKAYPKKLVWVICIMTSLGMAGGVGVQMFKDGTLNRNLRFLLVDGYQRMNWESIYMEDVFDEIEEAIGKDKATYSVVSVGIYPSIALYNGFTCADGYSNNYSLEYKKAFRQMIAGELEKNEAIREYFDEWGNRCYMVTAVTGYDMTVSKGSGLQFEDLDYNLDAMRHLNVQYIFSAAPITDEEFSGMLLGEGPFTDEKSHYAVWVYAIN